MRHFFTCLILLLLSACSTLPDAPPTVVAQTVGSVASSLERTADLIEPPLATDESAFHLLPVSRDALAWRLALIDAAENTIEAQYFVWHDDAAGALLLEHLFQAADRGVKVRLLVDDLHLVSASMLTGDDQGFAAVDFHPNLELRLFNPGKYRDGAIGMASSMITDSLSYNRRMHNKLLLVDDFFAIVGGRNIGDEYFGLADEFNFVDLDVAVFGAVMPQILAAFDQYWNTEMAYPAGALAAVTETEYLALRQKNTAYVEGQAAMYASLGEAATLPGLQMQFAQLQRGRATFLRDDPTRRTADEGSRLYEAINQVGAFPAGSAELISSTPYLIPSQYMLQRMREDHDAGIDVRIITNSLATNNQPAAHSHYKKFRNEFLDMDVRLFELHPRPQGSLRAIVDTPPVSSEFLALHMKAAVVDGKRCFIGTLNSDPRSLDINTENVIYVDSPGLCGELKTYLDSITSPDASWEVSRDGSGNLHWTSFEGTVDRQPAKSTSQRIMDSIYRIVPEGQL